MKNIENEFMEEYNELQTVARFSICPNFIIENTELRPQEKIMFLVIYSMSYKKGYFYGLNETLERKMNLKQWRISDLITKLEGKGYLLPDYEMKKFGMYREIRINYKNILPKARKFAEQIAKAEKKEELKMKSE